MGMACTPCRRRRGCTSHPGRGGIGLQEESYVSRGSEAGGTDRVECRAIAVPRTPPPYAPLPTESPADRARTLFFDVAEAFAVATEELQTTDNSFRGLQHSRLHGYSRRNDCARTGGSVLSDCSRKHEYQKTRANQRASPTVWINPIRSCRRIAATSGDAPCP